MSVPVHPNIILLVNVSREMFDDNVFRIIEQSRNWFLYIPFFFFNIFHWSDIPKMLNQISEIIAQNNKPHLHRKRASNFQNSGQG